MNEFNYRNMFPDNNIPKFVFQPKFDTSFEDKLYLAELFLSQYADFSKIQNLAVEIEFKHLIEIDPASALLQKLEEFPKDAI